MNDQESLERYGTVTLGYDFMRSQCFIDRIHARVECSTWIESIPEVYRARVVELIVPVCQEFIGRKLTERWLEVMVCAMHQAVMRIEPDPRSATIEASRWSPYP